MLNQVYGLQFGLTGSQFLGSISKMLCNMFGEHYIVNET